MTARLRPRSTALAATSGPYVIFLDADDMLLPHGVETHVYVHLSLRIHVGFTSGDLLQVADSQVVLGSEEAFNRVICAKPRRQGQTACAPIAHTRQGAAPRLAAGKIRRYDPRADPVRRPNDQ